MCTMYDKLIQKNIFVIYKLIKTKLILLAGIQSTVRLCVFFYSKIISS
jgi:hypothetical protein